MTLREEAIAIVNGVPDDLLASFVRYLKKFKPDKKISIDDLEVDPKKAAALSAIKEWQERNRKILESGIDWDKEIELAMEEKYGPFN